MGYAHFPVLVAIQCVVSLQAGPRHAWPGARPRRSIGASGRSTRQGAAIRPSVHDMNLYHDTILCCDRGQRHDTAT